MILPYGHDQGFVSRIPYVTLGIIGICFLLQIIASYAMPSDGELSRRQRRIKREQQILIFKAWRAHGREFSERHRKEIDAPMRSTPGGVREKLTRTFRLRKIFEAEYREGKIVDKQSADYKRYMEIDGHLHSEMGIYAYGFSSKAKAYTALTHMFIHGGWLHLIGNMLFLWICGSIVEDRWGPIGWTLFYLGGGFAALITFGTLHRWNVPVPMVGASGAIAAAMGAFLVLHGTAKLRCFYWFGLLRAGFFEVRAYWAFPIWFLQQLMGSQLESAGGGVAYSAHVGGFVFGAVVALVIRVSGMEKRRQKSVERKSTVYEGDPAYIAALDLMKEGATNQARERLQEVIGRSPGHVDAHLSLFRLAIDGKDQAAAVEAAENVVTLSTKDDAAAQQTFDDLRRHYPEAVDQLAARTLFSLAATYVLEDRRQALDLYEALIKNHSSDALVPRAMLNAAELLIMQRDQPAARGALEGVMQAYAGSSYADRAQAIVEQLKNGKFVPTITRSARASSSVPIVGGSARRQPTGSVAQAAIGARRPTGATASARPPTGMSPSVRRPTGSAAAVRPPTGPMPMAGSARAGGASSFPLATVIKVGMVLVAALGGFWAYSSVRVSNIQHHHFLLKAKTRDQLIVARATPTPEDLKAIVYKIALQSGCTTTKESITVTVEPFATSDNLRRIDEVERMKAMASRAAWIVGYRAQLTAKYGLVKRTFLVEHFFPIHIFQAPGQQIKAPTPIRR